MKIFNNETTESKTKKAPTAKVAKTKSAAVSGTKDLYADSKPALKGGEGKPAQSSAATKENAYRILARPLITEKATKSGDLNKYFFAVGESANKIEIAKAVSAVYGIKPVSVNIVSMLGKRKRSGRIIGKRKDWKKAIVTLPKGQTINLYEGV